MAVEIVLYEHLCALAADGQEIPVQMHRLGRTMRSALQAEFIAAGCQVRVCDTASIDSLSKLAAVADWTILVAPETAGVLARYAEAVLAAGGRLLGAGPDLIRRVAQKDLLAIDLAGVAAMPRPISPGFVVYPQVWKPRDGAGSQRTYLIADAQMADAYNHAANYDLLKQEYVAGTPTSQAYLVGPNACLALPVTQQCITDDGQFTYLGADIPAPVPLCQQTAKLTQPVIAWLRERFPFTGFIGMDCIIGGRDVLLEINPRISTSFAGLCQLYPAGCLGRAMLDLAAGRACELPAPGETVHFRLC
jgi:tyramine---L-glutamate ligase